MTSFHHTSETERYSIFAHEVSPLYPEGEFLCGMPGDANDGVVLSINPHLSFKQILVRPFWHRPDYETVIGPHLLFAKKFKRVICRGDGAVVMLLSGGCFNLTGDQRVERQTAHEPRT